MTEKNNTLQNVIACLIIFVMLFFAMLARKDYQKAKISFHYTIGTHTGSHESSDAGTFLDYTYQVNNVNFQESTNDYLAESNLIEEEKRYYVTFLPENPSQSAMHFDKPVHDSIQIVPEQGWYGNLDSLFEKSKEKARQSKYYTIAWLRGRASDKFVTYTFTINGEKSKNCEKDTNYNEYGRYYVSFLPNDHSVSSIHLDKPVPDYVIEPPQIGWWHGNLDSLFQKK